MTTLVLHRRQQRLRGSSALHEAAGLMTAEPGLSEPKAPSPGAGRCNVFLAL